MAALWQTQPVFCLTVDVDWASEEVIRRAHAWLEPFAARATYFLTHPSRFLDELLQRSAIDAGIHPNFMPGSSHGEHWRQVIDYCLNLLPHARCSRSHLYYDSATITSALRQAGLRYDSNLLSFLQPRLAPLRHPSGLVRFPCFFEDGTHLVQGGELRLSRGLQEIFATPGLKILAVHPLDMAINTPEPGYSRAIKDRLSRQDMRRLAGRELDQLCHPGRGIRDLVLDLLDWISARDLPVRTLRQLYEMHCEDRGALGLPAGAGSRQAREDVSSGRQPYSHNPTR